MKKRKSAEPGAGLNSGKVSGIGMLAYLSIIGGLELFTFVGWKVEGVFNDMTRWMMIALIVLLLLQLSRGLKPLSPYMLNAEEEGKIFALLVAPLLLAGIGFFLVALIPGDVRGKMASFRCVEFGYKEKACNDCFTKQAKRYDHMGIDTLDKEQIRRELEEDGFELVGLEYDYTILEHTASYLGYSPTPGGALDRWPQSNDGTKFAIAARSLMVVLEVVVSSLLFVFGPILISVIAFLLVKRMPLAILLQPVD